MKHGDIISKLTLEQKAALLTGRDFWSTVEYPEVNLPSAYLSDGPHGLRKQAAASDHLGLNASIPATCFPTAATMANSWNVELGQEMGVALGEEAAAQHVNVLLGPGMNVKRNPRCGRNFEYFSEDPYLAGKMASSYVKGIQTKGVAACLKHFAANNQEERRMVISSEMDERTLREIYLTGFEIAVKESKPGTIMSSYNLINGEFTNDSKKLLDDILRKEWGFDGVVVTDWAGCNSRVKGVLAGNELEMPSCKYGIEDVIKAVKNGELPEEKIDECLDRLIDLILRTDKSIAGAPEFDVEAHHDLARRCAEDCIVLLKNEGGVLPVKDNDKVCFIGDFANAPRYQGAGSSVVNPTKIEKSTQAGGDYSFEYVGYAQGFDRYGKKKNKLVSEALALAEKCDKVVFFAGLDEVTEAEGLDRRDIKIPQNQLDLLKEIYKLGKKVIVVLSCGSAVELDTVIDADAIVHSYLSGQASATATLNVLTGKVNPSGKLSETLPVKYEDCSSASHFPGKAMTVEYREGIFVGYRYYQTAEVPVQFPFGFGLSYTTFEYSDIACTDEGVKFTVKNTGSVDGKEVCQLYIGKKDSKIFRPIRELKGFAKVALKAGESKEVFIPFDDYTFRFFDVNTNTWQVEGGEYVVEVGASSQDIRLCGNVERNGTIDKFAYDKEQLPSYFSGKVADVSDEEWEKLLGRPIPDGNYKFYKKNRMVIHENCTIDDLRYSKRWVGRVFSWGIRSAKGLLGGLLGNRTMANTLEMGMVHQPIRGLAKFGGMSRRQMEGMLMMFNGHLFKGLGRMMTKDPEQKKAEKAAKKAAKQAQK